MSDAPKTAPETAPVLIPKCPVCAGELKGLNVVELRLPINGPDGNPVKYLRFMVPCCPHLECMSALSVLPTGEMDAPPPGAAAGLWTPPGAKH